MDEPTFKVGLYLSKSIINPIFWRLIGFDQPVDSSVQEVLSFLDGKNRISLKVQSLVDHYKKSDFELEKMQVLLTISLCYTSHRSKRNC